MKKAIIILTAVAMLAGCRTTKYVTVPEHHTDTVLHVKQMRDSIYLHDSTFVHEYVKGDTVRIVTEMWHTRNRDRWRTDTVYRSRVDSVLLPYETVREVPRRLTWWQQVRMGLGTVALMAGALWLAVRAFRRR